MAWDIVYIEPFTEWFLAQDDALREEIAKHIVLLQEFGPTLGRPHVDTLYDSKLTNLKELRVQFRGQPIRILFVFDPKRKAVLLLGGNKKGDDRWYKRNIPLAEKRYAMYLEQQEENRIEGH